MSRVLFVMLHPGFIRYYDDALQSLAAAGHDVHIAVETDRDKLGDGTLLQRLTAGAGRLTIGATPPRRESVRDFLARRDRRALRGSVDARPDAASREDAWESLATTVRLALDYLRFFEPAFVQAVKLRDRAEKRLPPVHVSLLRAAASAGTVVRRACAAWLRAIERIIPVGAAIEAFVREQRPDLLLVTPLIELGSQQVDYVKCARRLGVRSALCVASWDNLTSKGLIRVVPDHVVVWNDAQQNEAVTLHGVRPSDVVVTGAQLFDRWFTMQPSQSREAFCGRAGLDPARPFVLYVGSSIFIAPEEVPFVERWISRLRRSADPALAGLGVLVRPHPANARQWRAFDAAAWPGVAVWPTQDRDPGAPEARRDYFDTLFYSAAVVGINTSAQIEAGIVGRPVFTICTPEFAHSQEGTLHFQHLVNPDGGVVRAARSLDEHLDQLAAALRDPAAVREAGRRFVASFIRPRGLDVPATPAFVEAIGALARAPRPAPRGDSLAAVAARPFVFVLALAARALAEDRPLWVYPVRPLVTLATRLSARKYLFMRAVRGRLRDTGKQLRRDGHRAWYESMRASEQWWKRARGRARRALGLTAGPPRKP